MTLEPTITIELPTALTWVAGSIAALIAIIGFFLHRELKANDQAHKDLRADIKAVDVNMRSAIKAVEEDVKKLLAAVARIEGTLTGRRAEP